MYLDSKLDLAPTAERVVYLITAIRSTTGRYAAKSSLFNARFGITWTRSAEATEKPGLNIRPDPAVSARIRAYMALSVVERYGEHGPP